MRVMFVVHGMGTYPPGWSAPVVKKLDAAAGTYSAFRGGPPFSARVKLVEITYDGVFTRLVDSWRASADELGAAAKNEGLALPDLLARLDSATLPADARNAFWTTFIDPVLYRGISTIRSEVRARVTEQLVTNLTELGKQEAVQASVLCHGLGTMVVHDTLAILGSRPLPGGNDTFTSKKFRFENLFSLANASRLGPCDLDPYDSCVRPGSAPLSGNGGASNYLTRMYSFRHRWDPFAIVQPFDPTGWGSDYYGGPDQTLSAIRAANVHDVLHYLDHPAVHVPIINRAMGAFPISRQEMLDRIAQYPPYPPACADAVTALKGRLEELLHAIQNPRNLDAIATAGLAFYGAVRAAEATCADLVQGRLAA